MRAALLLSLLTICSAVKPKPADLPQGRWPSVPVWPIDPSWKPPPTKKRPPARLLLPSHCRGIEERQGSVPTKYDISSPTWLLTPSIVSAKTGYYRAIGRTIHVDYLKERLQAKTDAFSSTKTKEGLALVKELEILADTLYIKGSITLYGIDTVKIFAREIVAHPGSSINFTAPHRHAFKGPAGAGSNGLNGDKGVKGSTIQIFCDVITGSLNVWSNGGNGSNGQDAGDGDRGLDNTKNADARTAKDCTTQWPAACTSVGGRQGKMGHPGKKGGNGGRPGNGGDAGRLTIRYKTLQGKFQLKSCAGFGAKPGENGKGGKGGAGSAGGYGRKCKKRRQPFGTSYNPNFCEDDGAGSRGKSGPDGPNGSPGTTPNTPGRTGSIQQSYIQFGTLDAASLQNFPLQLIKIMRRNAEDLLLSNNRDHKATDTLQFILSLRKGRTDVQKIKKDINRMLGFLGKPGFDIFGKNELFAPRLRWDTLERRVERIKKAAKDYEEAFNRVIAIKNSQNNFNEMAGKLSTISSTSLGAERVRLEDDKRSKGKEKKINVLAIKRLEKQMKDILENVLKLLLGVVPKDKFSLLTLLQSLTGYSQELANYDPFDYINRALNLISSDEGESCLKTLKSYLASARKWLTFGDKYKSLNNSSNLDFDQLDLAALPEIMKANLEMNKETFAKELVCLVAVSNTRDLELEIEKYFIAGTARIDLIAKVMDLDNDIGGLKFDITILNDAENAIKAASTSGSQLSIELQQTFADDLLSAYQGLERLFVRKLYQFYKAIEFRTLWSLNIPLASFQRVASDSALGTKTLVGVVELTKRLNQVQDIKDRAVDCFSTNIYKTDFQKWSFSSTTHRAMFEELAMKGKTTLSIDIDQSCSTCYNVRLVKIYIELFGAKKQPDNVPTKVHINVRHRNSSYFRAGDNTIKLFAQTLGSRSIEFNRFTLTDEKQCQAKLKQGEDPSKWTYCITKDDSRWESMCSDPTKAKADELLGADECVSPFGVYDLEIPVDRDLVCGSSGVTDKNCKDLDLAKFTSMNVWTYIYYWPGQYPTGPNDPICPARRRKLDQTAINTE